MTLTRIAVAVVGVLAISSGCSTQSPSATPSSPQRPSSTNSQTAAPFAASTTVSQFAPQWMSLVTPQSWQESNRRVTREFQQFGLRPVDETEMPRRCNGCGVDPPTAFLTAYAPGKFDPAGARAAEPVTVNADNDGYFRASQNSEDALLAWQYADNAWATVRGRTTITSERDRMLELARALHPTDPTDIRAPLSIPNVPAPMPLTEISVDRGNYGTTLEFAACGSTDVSGAPDCQSESGSMRVQIWPADGYAGLITEQNSVPTQIGGRSGIVEADGNNAAVQVQPGMLVVFNLSGPVGQSATPPKASLTDILATVSWAPDPGSERTWPPIADWAKLN
ncbi:MAG: hypothetical protein WCP30_07680 [Mycobacteriaceae bacterium]